MLKLIKWKDSKYGVPTRERQIEVVVVVIIWVVGHGRGQEKGNVKLKS